MSDAERKTFRYLAENGPSLPRDLAQAVGITTRTQQRVDNRLEELGLITSTGQGRAKRYFIKTIDSEKGR